MWKGSVPIFRLIDATERMGGTEALWQKQEMLVAVLDTDDCAACLDVARALRAAEDDGEWAEENVGLVLLPIGDGDAIAEVVDRVFDALTAYGVAPGTPTLAVADRFGRLYAALDIHDTDVDDLLRQAHDWIDFVQEQCDECGVPLEPPAEAPLADSADDGPG